MEMPYVHDLKCRIQGRRASSRFYIAKQATRTGLLSIPDYHQLDIHSCGFLAALAVVRHFAPETEVDEVLRVVAPDPGGCDRERLIGCLKELGVTAVYHEGLSRRRLLQLAAAGTPVILTVKPEGYWDHWTVVRGLDRAARRIFLTNLKILEYEFAAANCSLPWKRFLDIWYDPGEALVCKRKPNPAAPRNDQHTENAKALRLPHVRVLKALAGTGSSLPLAQLTTAAGYAARSGTASRALYGVPKGSSSGRAQRGLLALGYVIEDEGGGRAVKHYTITPNGKKALEKKRGVLNAKRMS
jgi:hypothetical protein